MIDNTPDLGAEYDTEADTPAAGSGTTETVESTETDVPETDAASAMSDSA